MLTQRHPIGQLPAGTRFRFPEEARSQGFPYTILPIPATYRGDQHFKPGETPVVIYRKDGRYPRYGTIAGYFPVQDDSGKIVRWVAKPETQVLVPRNLRKTLALALLFLLLLGLALTATYGFLSRFGAS